MNKIDSLTSSNDIQTFINNEDNKINYYLNIEDKINYDSYCSVIADSLNLKQTWEKADFDHNGLTDLLVTGNTSEGPKTIYILDKGTHFESKNLSKGKLYEECSFSSVKDHKIEYHSIKILNRYGYLSNLIKENLIYKYEEFIEENTAPKRHNILEIKFENIGSRWNRYVFDMKIVSNRDATWTTEDDGLITSGIYKTKLSEKDFKEIIDLINYLDFENLEDEYNVSYSDSHTAYLTITYDNLKIKRIRDYGLMGSRGLKRLYDILSALKTNQQWTKQ
ncbi:DUF6438 domain-containing protein [Chryseobacterium kwangjuense]|uniref:DUF6438 domain-containing protein n=1 Tax=Chryseobacterium kwangjuense TaxID=267125 RepID=A0A135WEL2_9FLAO|nr:DUF6438 domain-containing protein [Chryseobacterium kwangjuense]KXH83325.1 hypothetical protein AU378_12995 [Chryseobacterium kwangjuense]